MHKICAVNVKKSSGTYTSDSREIKLETKTNSEYLKKQIAIYEPDFIICCGTDGVYFKYLSEIKPDWKMTRRGIWYVKENGKVVISYQHPEARTKSCIL